MSAAKTFAERVSANLRKIAVASAWRATTNAGGKMRATARTYAQTHKHAESTKMQENARVYLYVCVINFIWAIKKRR